jgi:hypothetical protein
MTLLCGVRDRDSGAVGSKTAAASLESVNVYLIDVILGSNQLRAVIPDMLARSRPPVPTSGRKDVRITDLKRIDARRRSIADRTCSLPRISRFRSCRTSKSTNASNTDGRFAVASGFRERARRIQSLSIPT